MTLIPECDKTHVVMISFIRYNSHLSLLYSSSITILARYALNGKNEKSHGQVSAFFASLESNRN